MLSNCGAGEDSWFPWTTRRSNKLILKEINSDYSLQGLRLRLQIFGLPVWRADSLTKILMLGKAEGRRRRGWQRMRWLNSITHSVGFPHSSVGKESTYNAGDLGSIPESGRSPGKKIGYPLQYSWASNSKNCKVHGVIKSRTRGATCTFIFTQWTWIWANSER